MKDSFPFTHQSHSPVQGGCEVGSPLCFVLDAYKAVETVETARQLGIFTQLEAGACTVEALSRACGTTPKSMKCILDALSALGCLRASEDGYSLPWPDLDRLLRRQSPGGQIMRHLQHGAPLNPIDTPRGARLYFPENTMDSARLMMHYAEAFAPLIARPALQILDLGAGGIPWSKALLALSPDCQVLAVDFPEVMLKTRALVEKAGLGAQFDFVEGNVLEVHLPPGAFDLILMGNLCQRFDTETNIALLKQNAKRLRTGGRLAIIDFFLPGEKLSTSETLHALNMLSQTTHGEVHSVKECIEWLTEAGFTKIHYHLLSGQAKPTLVLAEL